MGITYRELVERQLRFEETPCVPYGRLGCEAPLREKMTRHFGSEQWMEPIDNAAIVFGGIRERPADYRGQERFTDVYGVTWRAAPSDSDAADHVEHSPLEEPDIKQLKLPSAEQVCPDDLLENIDRNCAANPDRFTAVMFGQGIFERPWTLRGFQNALLDSIAEPEFYAELVGRVAEHQMGIVQRLCQTQIDAIHFGDDWGDQRGVTLGPERWRKFIKPHVAEHYEYVKKQGKYTFTHCCGCVTDIIPDMIEIGLDCLQSVQPEAMDPYELKRRFGGKIAFWGGLGSQSTLPFGTPEEIKAEVRKLCREMGKGGGFLLGPAKALRVEMPVENVIATIEAFNEAMHCVEN